MKIDIPKVIVSVNMAEYAPQLDGKYLEVWVNPPMEMLNRYNDLVADLQAQELENAKQVLYPPAVADAAKKGPVAEAIDQLAHWITAKKEKPADGLADALFVWYAELWSQGPEESQWTVDELRTLEAQDPTFLSWMIAQTWKVRNEHIERKKKV